jgi:hypothetical protein
MVAIEGDLARKWPSLRAKPVRLAGGVRGVCQNAALRPASTAAALALAAAVLLLIVPGIVQGAKPKPPTGVLLGAVTNTGDGAPWTQGRVLSFERMIGRKLDIDHIFYWTDASSGAVCSGMWPSKSRENWNAANKRINLISWTPDASLDATINGSLDSCIRKMAVSLKSVPGTLLLRWGWEMNGDWFPWSGASNGGGSTGQAKFRQAWIHTWTIFHQAGATNVKWVWCPNNGNYPYRGFYPGDRYVDWVGVDGYNWGGNDWQSMGQILTSGVGGATVYGDYSAKKPFMIAETGSVEDSAAAGRKGSWFDDARNTIKSRFKRIRALVYFNTPADDSDWRIETSTSSVDGFRKLALDPYFRQHR